MSDSDTQDYQELDDHNRLMEKLTEVIESAKELLGRYDPEAITVIVDTHNTSTKAHADIREKISTVEVSVTNLENSVNETIKSVKADYNSKISDVESSIENIIDGDGSVAYANRAKYNANNNELTDKIMSDLTFNSSTNVFALTRIDGTKSSFDLKNATTSTNGLMASTDKTALNTAVSDISTLKSDMTTAKTNISTLQTNVSTNSTNIKTAQSDITSIKSDVSTAKSNISTIQSNVSSIQSNIMSMAAKQTAITDTEIDSLSETALWIDGRCWNDSSWSPWQNRNQLGYTPESTDTTADSNS